MGSIRRSEAERRVAAVVDGAVGSNADSNGLKKHLRAIREAAGLPDPGAKGSREFLRDFGGGI